MENHGWNVLHYAHTLVILAEKKKNNKGRKPKEMQYSVQHSSTSLFKWGNSLNTEEMLTRIKLQDISLSKVFDFEADAKEEAYGMGR